MDNMIPDPNADQQQSVVPDPTLTDKKTPYTAAGTDQQALLTALATQRNSDSDESLSSTVARMKDVINQGNQPIIAKQVGDMRQAKEQKAFSDVQADVLANPQSQNTTLPLLVNAQINNAQKGADPNAIEKESANEMQDLGQQDPQQATLTRMIEAQGNGTQVAKDHVVKMMLMSKELDKIQKSWDDEGVMGKTGDVLGSLVPLRMTGPGSYGGNMSPGDIAGDLTSGKLPATALNDRIQKFMSLPLADFEKQLPSMVEDVKNSTAIGGQSNDTTWTGLAKKFFTGKTQPKEESYNHLLAINVLQNYLGGMSSGDKISYNAWGAADVLSALPIGVVTKMAKAPAKLLNLVGNRSDAVTVAAMDIAKDTSGIDKAADGIGPVMGPTGAVEESLPSSVIPKTSDLVRPYVGASSDIADKLDAMNQAIQTTSTISSDRLDPGQMQAAIEKTVKDIENKFKGENIVDVDNEPTFRTNPAKIANEHATHVSALDAEGTQAAGKKFFRDTSGNVKEEDSTPFVVARRLPDGTYKVGRPGQTHPDLINDNYEGVDDSQMGFVDRTTGTFYNRQEALAELKRRDPVVAERARSIDKLTTAQQDRYGLESETYNEARQNGAPLLVARQMPDGSVRVGGPGKLHFDLIDDNELEAKSVGFVDINDSQMGFVTPQGKFLSRGQAVDWIKKNQPELTNRVVNNGRQAGTVESQSYLKAWKDQAKLEALKNKVPDWLDNIAGNVKDDHTVSPAEVAKMRELAANENKKPQLTREELKKKYPYEFAAEQAAHDRQKLANQRVTAAGLHLDAADFHLDAADAQDDLFSKTSRETGGTEAANKYYKLKADATLKGSAADAAMGKSSKDYWTRKELNPEIGKANHDALAAYHNRQAAKLLGDRGLSDKLRSEMLRLVSDNSGEVEVDPNTGIARVAFYLGRKSGSGGYTTERSALAAAKRRGFAPEDINIHQDASGQYFIKAYHPVDETASSIPASVDLKKEVTIGKSLGRFTQFIKSPSNVLPDAWNQAKLTGVLQRTKMVSQVVKPLEKVISGADYPILRKVIDAGKSDQKWYNALELQAKWEENGGKPMTEKDLMGYYAYKELNDFNYQAFDRDAYITRARRGALTVQGKMKSGWDSGRMNGYEVPDPNFNELRILSLEDGRQLAPGENAEDLQKKFDTGNYRVVKLEGNVTYDDQPNKFIFGHKRDLTTGPLQRQQLGYVEGGNVEYKGKYFGKQDSTGHFEDGTSYLLNPITHVVGETKGEVQQWVNEMERARKAWLGLKKGTVPEDLAREAIEASPVENYEKWQQMVENGDINAKSPFQLVYDQGLTEGQRSKALGTDWTDKDLTPQDQYYLSRGRMYYSPRGDHLEDPSGNLATTLDPLKTIHRAAANAINTVAFADYNRKVVDEWARSAAPWIAGSGKMSTNAMFFGGQVSEDLIKADPEMYTKLLVARDTHKRFIGTSLPGQQIKSMANRQMAEWVEDKGNKLKSGMGTWAAKRIGDQSSRNPIEAVRGFVFDSLLGFFDPSQLLVQTQTAFAAASVHPVWGLRAAAATPGILWHMKNGSENLLDYVAQKTAAVHGFQPEEYKAMVRQLQSNSWLTVGGDYIQLDQYASKIYGSQLTQGLGSIREAGRWPFYTAERINRSVAYQLAWKETAQRMGGDYTSQAFLDRVLQRADDYSMNMTSASKAYWQEGALSVPTQFLAYQERFLESVIANPRWTAAERAKLAAGQLLMYGSGGVVGTGAILNYADDQYFQATGKHLDPVTWRTLSKGLWDTLFYYGSGGKMDTDFSSRAGTGAGWAQLYQKLSGGFGSSGFLDVVGGPTGEVVGDGADSVRTAMNYWQAEQTGLPSAEDWGLIANDVMSHVSVYNRAHKAYTIYTMGQVSDPKTGAPIIQADKIDALAAGLGIPLRQETERWDLVAAQKDQEAYAKEVGKQIAIVRRNAFQAMREGDTIKSQHYSLIAQGLTMNLRDKPFLQQQAMYFADKELGYNEEEWNKLVRDIYNRTGQKPVGEDQVSTTGEQP